MIALQWHANDTVEGARGPNTMAMKHANQIRTWLSGVGALTLVVAGVAYQSGPQATHRKSTDNPIAPKGALVQDLFIAIGRRDVGELKALLAKGGDPNGRNALEFTPLDMAAASFQPDAMQVLIDAGAKPDDENTYGTALTFAASSGNVPGVKLLLAKDVRVDVARTDGMTPLMMAAQSGSLETVGELIAHKADVNATDDAGATPLHYAVRYNHPLVSKLLIDSGAKVNAVDKVKETPLIAAIGTGRIETIRTLIAAGADVNARGLHGRTPLAYAAARGDYPEITKALIAAGANPNAVDDRGLTAAGIAAARRRTASLAVFGKPWKTPASRTPSQAATLGLKAVQASVKKFQGMATCISCHHEGLARIAFGAARDHGVKVDPAILRNQAGRVDGALNAMKPLHEGALHNPSLMKQVPLIEINEIASTDTWLLLGKAALHEKPTAASAAMTMVLARQQTPDGCWTFGGPRIPMQSSFFTMTALSIRSMQYYAPKSAAAEVAERTTRARRWLISTPTKTSEDRTFRLLGLKWTAAPAEEVKKAIAGITADQRKDGGWSQAPNLHSDAYATGQALYALREAGVPVTSPVYRNGVAFLLHNQEEDGTWFVNKRAVPGNNYFDAGYPYGQSQYASFIGACWAIMALLDASA